VNRAERTGLIAGLVLGAPFLVVGTLLIVNNLDATPPSSYLRFLVGGHVVHDAVVAPVALVIGYFLVGRAPALARAPLRAALFTSAVVVAIAWPGIRQYGRMRTPTNPTVQPLNYSNSVAIALVVVWVLAALWLVVARTRAHASGQGVPPGGGAT
jgi:hypothetical protein